MAQSRITVRVPTMRAPLVFVYILRPVISEDELVAVDLGLQDRIAWVNFRAAWIAATGRVPAADFSAQESTGLPTSLTRDDLTLRRPRQHAADARDTVRLLRCCRATYWMFGLEADSVRWNTAARLLENGWPAHDADLVRIVDAITTGP